MWTSDIQNSDELIYIRSFEPLEKCMTFNDSFPGLSRTLSFNFQDFPGPERFSRTFQVLEFLRKKNPGLSGRRGNTGNNFCQHLKPSYSENHPRIILAHHHLNLLIAPLTLTKE